MTRLSHVFSVLDSAAASFYRLFLLLTLAAVSLVGCYRNIAVQNINTQVGQFNIALTKVKKHDTDYWVYGEINAVLIDRKSAFDLHCLKLIIGGGSTQVIYIDSPAHILALLEPDSSGIASASVYWVLEKPPVVPNLESFSIEYIKSKKC